MSGITDVRLVDVSFSYPQQSSLLQHLDLHFSAGWTGVVGANGSGKSTLLQLITGRIEPVSGQVFPKTRHVTHQKQAIPHQDELASFAWEFSSQSLKWLSIFDLDPDSFSRWETLSAGERRRWQLAEALSRASEVLILDEPTNHLDTRGKELLLEAMHSFRGVGILVSHDRDLLDRGTNHTVRLHRGTAVQWPGSYSAARPFWQEQARLEVEALNRAQDEARAAQKLLNQTRAEHESSKLSLSTKHRMKNAKDSDARGMLAKGRAESAEARIGRSAGVLSREVQRLNRDLEDLPRPEKSREIRIDTGDYKKVLAEFDIGDELWFKQFKGQVQGPSILRVSGDSRFWVKGENGCGKSTLLRRLMAEIRIPQDELIWIEQEPDRAQVFAKAKGHGGDARSKMLHAAAALGFDVEIFLHDLPTSPGQLRKLAMAEGLVRQPALIVLDEPTNDLDIEGIEKLESALEGFGGSLVVVTHDLQFAKNLGLTPLHALF